MGGAAGSGLLAGEGALGLGAGGLGSSIGAGVSATLPIVTGGLGSSLIGAGIPAGAMGSSQLSGLLSPSLSSLPAASSASPLDPQQPFNPEPLKSVPEVQSSFPGTTNGVTDALKGLLPTNALDALKAAGLIGGAYLGSQTQPGDTITQQSKTDPRVDPYIYGDQGVLKSAQDWFLANKSGVNPTMQQGWDTRLGLLTNPATMSGLQGLQKNAMGLLSNPIASNPWIKG